MGDAVERLVEIAGAIQQQNALAQQQLDAARLANQLPELDQERTGGGAKRWADSIVWFVSSKVTSTHTPGLCRSIVAAAR